MGGTSRISYRVFPSPNSAEMTSIVVGVGTEAVALGQRFESGRGGPRSEWPPELQQSVTGLPTSRFSIQIFVGLQYCWHVLQKNSPEHWLVTCDAPAQLAVPYRLVLRLSPEMASDENDAAAGYMSLALNEVSSLGCGLLARVCLERGIS